MDKAVYSTSLLEMQQTLPEERIGEILSSYSCPPNLDVEKYLHEKALSFSKSSLGRTYLVDAEVDGKSRLVGFFTLSPKSLVIKHTTEMSSAMRKRIAWFSDPYPEYGVQIASVVMIAQLGKNYSNENNAYVSGAQILDLAFTQIKEIQDYLGGKLVLVECEDTPPLVDFYTANGFRRLQNRNLDENSKEKDAYDYLVQLIRTL